MLSGLVSIGLKPPRIYFKHQKQITLPVTVLVRLPNFQTNIKTFYNQVMIIKIEYSFGSFPPYNIRLCNFHANAKAKRSSEKPFFVQSFSYFLLLGLTRVI